MPHRTLTTIFFAGTDTEVGKTHIAVLAARYFRQQGAQVGVYKPVASGCRQENGGLVAEDAVALWQAAGQPRTLQDVCPQRFSAPLAPPAAAALEGRTVDAKLLYEGAACWGIDTDILIVEGAGGLFSPLADGVLNVDLAKHLKAKLIVVAANRLGAIHQTLATCAAAAHHQCVPCGVILNAVAPQAHESVASNAAQIQQYTTVPLLASVPFDGGVEHVQRLGELLMPCEDRYPE
jgi:dethiobiotin synthetase